MDDDDQQEDDLVWSRFHDNSHSHHCSFSSLFNRRFIILESAGEALTGDTRRPFGSESVFNRSWVSL